MYRYATSQNKVLIQFLDLVASGAKDSDFDPKYWSCVQVYNLVLCLDNGAFHSVVVTQTLFGCIEKVQSFILPMPLVCFEEFTKEALQYTIGSLELVAFCYWLPHQGSLAQDRIAYTEIVSWRGYGCVEFSRFTLSNIQSL